MARVLLVGAGKFGQRFFHYLINKNHHVTTLSRSEKSWSKNHIEYDLLSKHPANIDPLEYERVFFILAPNERSEHSYRSTYIDSITAFFGNHLFDICTHCTFISATSVYGSQQLGMIDESAIPTPDNYRGQILLEAEENIKRLAKSVSIVRASGLYSKSRHRLVESLLSKESIDNPKWLNLIHEDDLCQWLDIASSQQWPLSIASDGYSFQRKNATLMDHQVEDDNFRQFNSVYLPKINLRYPSFANWYRFQ